MFIIECLPLSKGLDKESLSYFGPEYLEPGSLLKVNLRGKSVSALAIASVEAVDLKSEIKSANFQLKKISSVTAKPFLQKEFLESVKTTADYFVTTAGNVLTQLIPSFILENPAALSISKLNKDAELSETSTKGEVAILQASDEERTALYRSLIREEFAKKKSVFMCLPQNADVRLAQEKLGRGIEAFVCTFHNEMSKKEIQKEWKRACQTAHPILIIATARWLFLTRNDLGTIIIDEENDNGWKTLNRPFLDLRFFAETLAIKKNIRAVIGDSFLRTETLYRYKLGEIAEFENVKWRLPSEVQTVISDLRESNKRNENFTTLSPALLDLIKEVMEKNSQIFIFAARKGLSSMTICRDCGEQVKCNNCLAPMILYKVGENGVFKCHQCGETRDAAEVCAHCGSWKLMALGAGIDRVSEDIKKNIPNAKLFEIHKDITTTASKAKEVAENFYASRGAILLGTEMSFSFLHKKIGSTSVASFDPLFSIPDFRIREKIFRTIIQIKNLAREHFLIQTRNPNDPTVEFAAAGNLIEFYKKEVADRQILNYPPFGIFIKITMRGNKVAVNKETENLKIIFKDYNTTVFNSVYEKKGEQAAINAVIKLTNKGWPETKLVALLRSLPAYFEIKVDPDSLL